MAVSRVVAVTSFPLRTPLVTGAHAPDEAVTATAKLMNA
jgi:hypothetical protein